MRLASLIMLLLLSACGGVHSSAGSGPQNAELPAVGTDASRDGFYDGGVFDPDLTRRNLPVDE